MAVAIFGLKSHILSEFFTDVMIYGGSWSPVKGLNNRFRDILRGGVCKWCGGCTSKVLDLSIGMLSCSVV